MLDKAILVLTIITLQHSRIDYEIYDDIQHCKEDCAAINSYPSNSTLDPRVQAVCIEIHDSITKEV